MEVSDGHHEFETSQEDHVVDDPIAHGEKHQVAMGEDHQVAMTSLTSSVWPVLQRWVEERHEAVIEKATRHIQNCLRSQMVEKWAQAAFVIPPGLSPSSSDDDRVNDYLHMFRITITTAPVYLRMHQRNVSSGSEEESTSSSEDDAADVQISELAHGSRLPTGGHLQSSCARLLSILRQTCRGPGP